MKKLFYLITLSLFIVSCGSEPNTEEISTTDSTATENQIKDDANAEFTAADTSSTGVYQEEVDDSKEMTLQEALKADNQNSSEEEEGGMSFCDCVKKQKELEKIMLETEDDAEFDNAMKELEEMKTGDCKILFEGNQSTVEDKKAHEQKVKRCL